MAWIFKWWFTWCGSTLDILKGIQFEQGGRAWCFQKYYTLSQMPQSYEAKNWDSESILNLN